MQKLFTVKPIKITFWTGFFYLDDLFKLPVYFGGYEASFEHN